MKLKTTALAAVSMMALVSPFAAHAQTDATPPADATTQAPVAGEETSDEIVVTGYRQSLRTALNQKRNADRVVESLSAEDLGKLPEASIAESLARLPGLATNRDRGNGTQISIRGMGPNLVNTLLNGREIASAEGSRNIRYEQFPAELLTGASVFKSPTASQVEGAIAGQVDLKTVRPLDYKETRVVLNGRAIYSDLAEDVQDTSPWGWIASASVVTQLFDDTLGLAIGYSGRRQSVATVRTNIFRYTNSFADLDGNGQGAPGHDGAVQDDIPFGYEGLARGGDDIRHGAVAALQWHPSDRFEINGDFLYSRVSFDETQRGFRVGSLPFGNSITDVTTRNGYVTGATITQERDFGQQVRGVNEMFFFKDDLYAGGVNMAWHPDGWDVTGDVGYSKTHRNQQYLTLQTAPFGFTPTTRFESGNNSVPLMTINSDLSDPSLFRVMSFEVPGNGGASNIDDELLTLSTDFRREIGAGPLAALRFGVRHTDRTKQYIALSQYGEIAAANRQPLDASLLNPVYRFTGAYSNLPAVQSIDIIPTIERLFGPLNPQQSQFDQTSSWLVKEKTSAIYSQVDLEGRVFGIPFSGNVGLRVVRSETDSRSTRLGQYQPPGGQPTVTVSVPVVVANEFYDWLPSLNLTFKPTDNLQLRFAASEAIARPPLDDLNAGQGIFNFGTPSGNGGNPLLEPFRAKQLDATIEWYFDRDSALTVSGFYKDLSSYITRQVSPIAVPNPAGGPDVEGTFSQPINGSGGTIKGFEVLFQKAFTFLPAPLDGFGVYLNYSFTDSDISVTETDNAIGAFALPGLSKHVGNATLYYSKAGWDIRAGFRYRSEYVTELGDTDRILFNAPESVLDLQANYKFPENSALAGLWLMAQANNVTDEPFETYYGDRNLQGRYEKFGRRFLIGAGFEF